MCKHLWAFVLHLDHAGIPERVLRQRSLELRPGPPLEILDTAPSVSPVEGPDTLAAQRAGWRQILKIAGGKSELGKTSPQEIFVVLEAPSREDDFVKFSFFAAERS